MFIKEPEPKCSKCGARHSEFFNDGHKSGRRCLSCGHSNAKPLHPDTTTQKYTNRDAGEAEF